MTVGLKSEGAGAKSRKPKKPRTKTEVRLCRCDRSIHHHVRKMIGIPIFSHEMVI
jgi:hypothetical protein